jgi:hypothetical protein
MQDGFNIDSDVPEEHTRTIADFNSTLARLRNRRVDKIDVAGSEPLLKSKLAWKLATYQQPVLYRIVMLATGGRPTTRRRSHASCVKWKNGATILPIRNGKLSKRAARRDLASEKEVEQLGSIKQSPSNDMKKFFMWLLGIKETCPHGTPLIYRCPWPGCEKH